MYGGYTLTCAPVAVSYVRTNPGMFDRALRGFESHPVR